MGCHSLLQGVFPTQGLSPGLLCLLSCRARGEASKTGASESEAGARRPRGLVSCAPHPWRVRDRELARGQDGGAERGRSSQGHARPTPSRAEGEGAVGRRVSVGGAGPGPQGMGGAGCVEQHGGPGRLTFPNSVGTGLPGADLSQLWAAFHHRHPGLAPSSGTFWLWRLLPKHKPRV